MAKKAAVIIGIICLWSVQLHAQDYSNLPNYDNKPFHFGFSLGVTSMGFNITPSLLEIDGKTYRTEMSSLNPGFSVGIITDLRISRYLNLRANPSLNIADRELFYSPDRNITSKSINITSIPVCLPIYLKYSAERYHNTRPYLIGGGGFYVDLGRDKTKPVLLKPFDVYAEVGIGCDIYLSFFKLSPELKFGFGFNDMLTPLSERDSGLIPVGDQYFTSSISKLKMRMVTLAFNFE